MYYAPHILERWREPEARRDEHGRLMNHKCGTWERVCSCRCDLDGSAEIESKNHQRIQSRFKVTADLHSISNGMKVRILRADGSVIGEGEVSSLRTAEYLQFMSFYL